MYSLSRFSHDAQEAMVRAQEEAVGAGHGYLGTEHLLLALAQQESEAGRILRELGVQVPALRERIDTVVSRDAVPSRPEPVPTTRVRDVVDHALGVVAEEGGQAVSSEQLLVGLLREGEGVAAHVLADLGVTLENVQARRGRGPAPAM